MNKLYTKYYKYLAGRIEKEFIFPEEQWIVQGLKPAFDYWIQESKHLFEPRKKVLKEMIFNSIWVNRQIAGEYNPVHIHTNADLSFVLWLSVPKKLDKDVAEWKKTHNDGGVCPGYTSFYYGEEDPYVRNFHNFAPSANTILVFPATLRHDVQAFKCPGERISVAGNVNLIFLDQ